MSLLATGRNSAQSAGFSFELGADLCHSKSQKKHFMSVFLDELLQQLLQLLERGVRVANKYFFNLHIL